MKKYSIVIPCYNREQMLPMLLQYFNSAIKTKDIEVILVNNGSTDNTPQALKKLLPTYPFARSITIKKNKGYGHGIIAGLKKARGDYIGWAHASLKANPCDIIKAFEYVESHSNQGYFFIKGIRKKTSLFEKFLLTGTTLYKAIYLRKFLHDIDAQPTIFPCSFFKQWKNPPLDNSLNLYAFYLAKKQRLDIIRIPTYPLEKIYGASSLKKNSSAIKNSASSRKKTRKQVKQKELL
jgi:polyisoprenyl-phosphate glycosyltransferase